jgi:hypothetical protein
MISYNTYAYSWNESSKEERYHYFETLLRIISGEGAPAEHIELVTADMMSPMPLHNYDDLPRSLVHDIYTCSHDIIMYLFTFRINLFSHSPYLLTHVTIYLSTFVYNTTIIIIRYSHVLYISICYVKGVCVV